MEPLSELLDMVLQGNRKDRYNSVSELGSVFHMACTQVSGEREYRRKRIEACQQLTRVKFAIFAL